MTIVETFDANRSSANTVPLTSRFPDQPTIPAREPRKIQGTESLPISITDTWGAILRAHMSVEMYGNLVRLASAADGWAGPKSKGLDAAAMNRFFKFWQLVKLEAVEPILTLAPDGSLVAEWFKSIRQRLDVRFSAQDVIFGLITPKRILEGAESAETVATILKLHPQKPLSWHEEG